VSAFGITPTFTATLPTYLAPFALWTAFPSADYYGASVAMRLAPGRQSRVPSTVDVQDGLGALFVSFFRPLQTAQLPRSAADLTQEKSSLLGEQPDFSHRFRPDPLLFGHWGSGNAAFTLPSGPRRTCRLVASRHPGFPDMLLSPTAFAFRWVWRPRDVALGPSYVAQGSTAS
jgi:hypothetical protein